jgi:hypothetical protein
LLHPYLRQLPRSAGEELLSAATNERYREIRLLIAGRFPQADMPTQIVPLAPVAPGPGLGDFVALRNSIAIAPGGSPVNGSYDAGALIGSIAPNLIAAPAQPAPPRVAPLSSGRFAFQMTIGQSAHDKLQKLKALLSHEIPSGDLEQIFE